MTLTQHGKEERVEARPLGKEGRLMMLWCCCGVVVVLLWCFGDSFLFLVSLYNIYWIIKWYSLFPCKHDWPPRPRCSSDVVMLLFPPLQLNLNHGNSEKKSYVNKWISHCTSPSGTHKCSLPWDISPPPPGSPGQWRRRRGRGGERRSWAGYLTSWPERTHHGCPSRCVTEAPCPSRERRLWRRN